MTCSTTGPRLVTKSSFFLARFSSSQDLTLSAKISMSRSMARRIYADAFARWPKQDLRPDYQLQDILRAAVDERYKNLEPAMEAEEILKARALQFLVQNKYNERFKLQGPLLEPKSQPTYFNDLIREIEEAPRRTWLERLGKRLSGMIRLQ
ncbi:hypothetical protein E4U53_006581 [Claviceps sorghi]|nr:hypothetical protein E4U53_006581 [Claviceps sorghi]